MGKIILASKSPRRIEILQKYCNDIEILVPEIIERIVPNESPSVTVMRLAYNKASEAMKICLSQGIIIAADTIVYLDEIMGKPNNSDEAFVMLSKLSGKTHKVYTGVCLIDTQTKKKIVDYEETLVTFRDISNEEISRYLDTGEYKDKAGAYGIQGYGEILVKSITGCYNNVKGLPVSRINELLKKHFGEYLL